MDPLRALSLAISLANNDPSAVDARREWADYAWVELAFGHCINKADDGLCLAAHQKWDWKRNQWVDFSYGFNAATNKVTTQLRLTNNDPNDSDDVCVTALFVDSSGNNLFVFHENWHILGKQVLERTFVASVPDAVFADTVRVVVGSKQCRGGPHEDDDLFTAVQRETGQR